MHKRIILPLALALLGLAGCASSDVEVNPVFSVQGQGAIGSPESWLDQGRREYAADRCGLAIRHFRNALNADPDSVHAMNGMAACYDRLKRFDLSERFYRAALVKDPRSAQTLNNLGYSYYLQNKPDLAVSFLQEAIRRGAQNPPIKKNILLAERALNKKMAATDVENKAVKKHTVSFASPSPQPVPVNKVRMVRTGKSSISLLTQPQNLEWQAAILQPPVTPKRETAPPVVAKSIPRAEIVIKTAKAPKLPPKMEKLQPIKAVLTVVAAIAPVTKASVQDVASVALKLRHRFAVEVSNGTGRRRMAARMREYLAESGHNVRWLSNAKNFRIPVSTIFYKPGAEEAASLLAGTLPVTPRLTRRDAQRASLQLELGKDLLRFDRKLIHSYDDVTKVPDHVEL